MAALYDPNGCYRYTGGWSLAAIIAFLVAALPSLPGFLAQVGAVNPAGLPHLLLAIYSFAWFSGFAIAFVAYLFIRKIAPNL